MSAPTAEHFVIDTHRDGSTEVVVVRGEVDAATVPLLRAVLDTVVGRRPGRLEVDLSGASYLGVHALTTLAQIRGLLTARRVRLVLRDPSPAARRLLARTDLALDIVDGAGAGSTTGPGRQLPDR